MEEKDLKENPLEDEEEPMKDEDPEDDPSKMGKNL